MDSRSSIKIKFKIYGKTYKTDMNINYFPNGDGIDERILDWFSDCFYEASGEFQLKIEEVEKKRCKEMKVKEAKILLENEGYKINNK